MLPSESRPVARPGNSPTCVPARARADQERRACRAVVGPARAVLLRAPAELGPDERQHAVGDAARLEVALEGVAATAAVVVRPGASAEACDAWVS